MPTTRFVLPLRSGLLFLLLLLSPNVQAQPGTEKQVLYLSGKDNRSTVKWDFFCTGGRQSGYWTTIAVPSCWEQQGFGLYNYGRDYKTYGKNFRFADEQGRYRHTFTVPSNWKERRVEIVFEGSMTDTEVTINGQPAGPIHQGAFYRFRYDITDKLKGDGPNLLEVTVSKMSADKTVNNAERLADYWVFGGIFRPVYLQSFPRQFVDNVAVDAKASGAFAVQAAVHGVNKVAQVQAEILDAAGQVVGTAQTAVLPGDTLVRLTATVRKPQLWTAETPNLYHVRLTLRAGTEVLYQTKERFGFRTIEVRRGKGIFVNGVQVKLKGIDRHSWWPETGRTLNDSIHRLDVKLLKEMNMNAVRMAHYPPDVRFLELCDSLGLYVLDELAGWQKAYGTVPGRRLVAEMVRRDVNHPSILFWSNGNEGGTNKELDAEFDRHDPSRRPVIHAHHRPGNAHQGIDTNHYEDFYSTKKILADSLIYMPTEFLHCQDDGGGGAGLEDLWELHWQAPRSGGGFLWAFVDEGIVRTDQGGIIDVNGVNAPDGVVGPHREKEGSFYAIRAIFSPIHIRLKELPAKFNGTVEVENRYHFTNLSQCFFQWELVSFRRPHDPFTGTISGKKARVKSPSLAPLGTGKLKLDLPAYWKSYDALVLSAYDPQKNLVSRWTWKTGPNARLLADIVRPDARDKAAVNVTETDSTLTLKASSISVTFSKASGHITAVKGNNGDPLSFGQGPVLAAGTATFRGLTHRPTPEGQVVEVRYDGDLKALRWTMHPSGWLRLDYEYALTGVVPFSGLTFTYPENFVIGAKWLGQGPYRVWKNRLPGGSLSVWKNANNHTPTGAAPWLYPEFKGYFADVVWMELNTVEGKFLVASPDPGLFVRRFDFYGLSGIVPQPRLPAGNLSFLDAIPPIGTKLGLRIDPNPQNLGPASELNHFRGETRKRTLYFYFGLAPSDSKPQPYTAPVKDDLF
ncbi:glycoside hydrolase family 2 [Hymenobacter sp. BT175]|uniref:glycoside hydrolase family 2 protein n=1 Tax=Hymenobacter translucens TaxID=2886507 RepID=UPI001D0ED6D3|nr:glycoside hydrolase family 2 TIM barrel-domain containing protein [Hymenobacter translucens]MCC2547472.1 glycoside hydrolase family 2 [Hymenobacter translucens]